MEFLSDPNLWIAFAMLTALEIVLGVDNIIFISILVGRLPPEKRDLARKLGLGFAMISRLLLLFSLSWVMSLQADLFSVLGQGISGRDIVLLLGGLFGGAFGRAANDSAEVDIGPLGIHPGMLASPPRSGAHHRDPGPLLLRHGPSAGWRSPGSCTVHAMPTAVGPVGSCSRSYSGHERRIRAGWNAARAPEAMCASIMSRKSMR